MYRNLLSLPWCIVCQDRFRINSSEYSVHPPLGKDFPELLKKLGTTLLFLSFHEFIEVQHREPGEDHPQSPRGDV